MNSLKFAAVIIFCIACLPSARAAETADQRVVTAFLGQFQTKLPRSSVEQVDEGSCQRNPNYFWCANLESVGGSGGVCCNLNTQSCTYLNNSIATCIPKQR